MNPIIQLILQALPSIISAIQQAHTSQNPLAPPLTAEQIHAAFEELYTSTILKDELIRTAHRA